VPVAPPVPVYNCGNGKQIVLSNIYKPLPTHPLEMGKGKLYHAFADMIGCMVENLPQIVQPALLKGFQQDGSGLKWYLPIDLY
jgi:hypothetical protein